MSYLVSMLVVKHIAYGMLGNLQGYIFCFFFPNLLLDQCVISLYEDTTETQGFSCLSLCSVPTFQGLPEETLTKLADVMEEVRRVPKHLKTT